MYEQYTDKQIVEMLVPKLEKLGCEPEFFSPRMKKLISILYKSGYIRGQLGRSFSIGEKKAKESATTFEVGDRVKFLGLDIDDGVANKRFYPPVNTVGKVVELGCDYCFVRWPKGITSGDGTWGCRNIYLEKVTEHWVPATKDNVKVGSKVKMIYKKADKEYRYYYPVVGAEGVVTNFDYYSCEVQWPEGVILGSDKNWYRYKRLEVLLCE